MRFFNVASKCLRVFGVQGRCNSSEGCSRVLMTEGVQFTGSEFTMNAEASLQDHFFIEAKKLQKRQGQLAVVTY